MGSLNKHIKRLLDVNKKALKRYQDQLELDKDNFAIKLLIANIKQHIDKLEKQLYETNI